VRSEVDILSQCTVCKTLFFARAAHLVTPSVVFAHLTVSSLAILLMVVLYLGTTLYLEVCCSSGEDFFWLRES